MTQKEIMRNLKPGDQITIQTPLGFAGQMLVIENTRGNILLQEATSNCRNKLEARLHIQ